MLFPSEKVFSVTELNSIIKEILEGTFPTIRLEGEISGLKVQSSGHIYFSLKDSSSLLSAVMFRGSAQHLSFFPKDGMKVQVSGKLSVYHGAKADDKDIDFIADAINNAKSPVIIAGGGIIISESSELLNKLAKKANIPVATTMMCLGAFDRRDELSVGMVGMHGEKEANQAVANSDLILALGTRFSDRVVGDVKKFASKAKIIHI